VSAFHPLAVARRARGARVLVWVAALLLLSTFFRTQVLSHRAFALQSETNRLRPIPLPAPRGVITDRAGRVLADNVPGFTIALLPGPDDSLRATLVRIAPLVGLDTAGITRVLQRYRRAPYLPAVVRHDAPLAMVAALEERRLEIPGLIVQTEPKRYYPDSAVAAHVLGYIGEVTESERGQVRFADVRLGGLVGKDGVEREYDATLRGKDGVRFVEVSALGRMVREGGEAAALVPVPGSALRTALDLDLQRYVASIFPRGKRGAVMALDPETGAVLALYSAPGFDPNAFVGGVDPEYWRALNEDDARPLLNRAIQARYPPGSTWKLAIAAMALRRGIAGFNTRMPVPCRGGLQYGNRFFRCWRAEGHGTLTLTQAIAHSCDVYFYQLGLKLGVAALLEDGVALGARGRTGIDLPGELQSVYPSGREYYDRLYGPRRWTSAVALNLSIGQGENDQTLVNVIRLYQMVAGDGRARVPRVAGRPQTGDSLDVSAEQLAGLRRALVSVVEGGTARGSRVATLTIAGKTATAQNPHGPDHGWFIAFAPADQPRIVVGAVIEFAEHGSAVAPLVTRVIARYLGVDSTLIAPFRVPEDTAPAALDLEGWPAVRAPPDSIPLDSIP
jgi:penicillin-binding protein 2